MALRLSAAPELPQQHAGPSASDEATLAARLHARASACLGRGDLSGYAALFDEAAAAEDLHRRHQALCTLLEAGLTLRGDKVSALAAAFVTTARKAVELLEAEPREPRILNAAGIAFYELGELRPAEQLFSAAARLDPDLPYIAGNLEEIARRRRAGQGRPKLPAPVTIALRELAPRASRVAAAARPAEGLTLSLCMIVKDEEALLGQCLAAVKGAVDEIVVVDTGSTDRTKEIAAEHGARVLDFEWTGSFSDARNASFEAATGDWVMYLDADEVLAEGDAERLRALTGRVWREAFYLIETNHTGDLEDGTAVTHNALRVFRNRPWLRFEGRIHEQIAQHLPGFLPERIEISDVRVEHFGYLGAVRDAKGKSRRNIELLEAQAAEGVDTPFQAYNLGSEYTAAGDPKAALEHFERAWRMLEADPPLFSSGFVPSLAGRLVRSLRTNGRFEDARTKADQVLELFPGFTDALLERALCTRALGDLPGAAAEFERCLTMGDAPSRYSPTVGCGTYVALVALADLRVAQGELAEAERLLRRCRAEHPTYLPAVEPLATVLLRSRVEPDEVVAVVEDADAALTPGARFMLAVALHEAGAVAHAEAQLRLVLDAQPGAEAARVALAETLLSQARLDDAVAVAAAVGDTSPFVPAAMRTELFARLAAEPAGGDDAAIEAALARAARGGLHPAEAAALRAWHELRAGGEPPASLPGDAAPLLLTMLEALLKLEAFDAFGRLLPAAHALQLPWRERHERLASMYLRRGFLESAADEWVAVVQEAGPDIDALVGLAQVAEARGFAEDARMLAEEAQALEPGHPVAALVLEAVAA